MISFDSYVLTISDKVEMRVGVGVGGFWLKLCLCLGFMSSRNQGILTTVWMDAYAAMKLVLAGLEGRVEGVIPVNLLSKDLQIVLSGTSPFK